VRARSARGQSIDENAVIVSDEARALRARARLIGDLEKSSFNSARAVRAGTAAGRLRAPSAPGINYQVLPFPSVPSTHFPPPISPSFSQKFNAYRDFGHRFVTLKKIFAQIVSKHCTFARRNVIIHLYFNILNNTSRVLY
jgi:hypothetical protein